jgi:single-strand selective monofunctional uracil DNA glycosylase
MKKSKLLQSTADRVVAVAAELRDRVDELDFGPSVPWVYNPLNYAWQTHEQYLRRYANETCQVLFLGMNPGPWGMAQTGVPFGEVSTVVDFLGIDGAVSKPRREHPKRPIEGLGCKRSEVSGQRLWGLFKSRYKKAEKFFMQHFVANYCPLVFMEESAKNLTPDKLPGTVRKPLEGICDVHLAKLIEALSPQWVIGIGGFAEDCAKRVLAARLAGSSLKTGRILHPSPASPAANRDWAGTATKQLIELGIWK